MREKDPIARKVFHRYLDRLGRALAVVCNIVDPETIVFGGGLSNVPELFAALPAIVESHVFSESWTARLMPARWGDSSGVRGAARLWPSQHS
jgi:fructokinase